MHIIRLRINDTVYERILWLLGKFSADEVEVIAEDKNFQENKRYLDAALKKIDDGDATFLTIEELDERLEKTIKKHENIS